MSEAPRSQNGLIAAIVFSAIIVSGSILFFAMNKSGDSMTALLKQNPQLATLLEEMKKQNGDLTGISLSQLVDNDASFGNPDAKVTLVEFSDYQCPFCRKYFVQTFDQIKKNFIDTGKVRYVYRDFPLSFHPDALNAAKAAECSRVQGGDSMYFQMHGKIFSGEQKSGSGTVAIPRADLTQYASELKLDTKAFDACVDSDQFSAEIAADTAAGSAFGIDGTPGFIISNGKTTKAIKGAQPYSAFETQINALLGS